MPPISDTALIAIVVGVVIVFVVLLLRGRLAGWEASWKGAKTRLTTHAAPPEPGSQAGTDITGNRQSGTGHEIDVGRDASIRENRQRGKQNKITVRSDGAPPSNPSQPS